MSKRQRSSTVPVPPVGQQPLLVPPPGSGPPAPLTAAATKRPKPPRKALEGTGEPTGVTFNPYDRAAILTLSRDRRTATCQKGYRMLKATVGVSSGAWYCEFMVSPDSKAGAHYRLGCSTELGESHGPVGYSHHSYGYRDVGGARVHQSIRSTYGRAYGAGDVVGVLVDFNTPAQELTVGEGRDGGASGGPADGVRQGLAEEATKGGAGKEEIEGILHSTVTPTPPPPHTPELPNGKHTVKRRWWGSSVRFFVNGEDQGIAFVHLTKEARIHPAASMFGGGAVRLNPGPVFSFPPSPSLFPCASPSVGVGVGVGAAASVPPAAAAVPAAATSAAAVVGGVEGDTSGGGGCGVGVESALPKSSPWRPLCEADEGPSSSATSGGLPLAPLSSASASAAVASSTLSGTGLLRVGTGGGTAYNFKNTQFAYSSSSSSSSAPSGKKEGGGRKR